MDRSRTAEDLYNAHPGVWARSRGTWESARRRLREEDLEWADLVLVMEEEHREAIRDTFRSWWERRGEKVETLRVSDLYGKGDPKLVKLLERRVREVLQRRGLLPD